MAWYDVRVNYCAEIIISVEADSENEAETLGIDAARKGARWSEVFQVTDTEVVLSNEQ